MARAEAIVLSPIALAQAEKLRRATPILPEPPGGRTAGEGEPRILVLGDSTAVGIGAHSMDDSIAGHLHRRLGGSYRIVGRSGATAEEIRRDHLEEAIAEPFDLAVTLVGWNDAMRLRTPRAFGDDLAAILASLRARTPEGAIVVIEPPRFSGFTVMPPTLRRALEASAAGLRRTAVRVAHEHAASAVPGFQGDHLATDNFHPDETGYALLARSVARAIGA